MKNLLLIRKALKARKPEFIPEDYHKKKRIRVRWRKPRGSDSKMRQHLRGNPRVVKIGWRSPRAVRGMHPNGKKVVVVSNESDIKEMQPEHQCALLSGKLGLRKKMLLAELLQKKKIMIVNAKDASQWIENTKKKREEAKVSRSQKKKAREEKRKKAPKEKKKEKDLSETVSEEEKKEQEKKEHDKLLRETA